MISHSRPLICPDDIKAVSQVLKSGMLANGKKVRDFECAIAAYINRGYAAAVSSGTAALYVLLSALGISSDDEVVIPSYVCSSLLYAVRMTGASPILADSGDDPFHIDGTTVKKVLTPRVKAVIFPHMFGSAQNIGDIIALGVPVIEDCALSLGSQLNGVRSGNFGSCASFFSFYATKVIATGEGGMVVSDDKTLIERIRDMIDYVNKPDTSMHFNFKMTNIMAALGLSQLKKLENMIQQRRCLASQYSRAFADKDLKLPTENPGERHIFYRYVLQTKNAEGLRNLVRKRGVCAERPVYLPLSCFPGIVADCPRAEETWRTSLSIPLYPALSDSEVQKVIHAVLHSIQTLNKGD